MLSPSSSSSSWETVTVSTWPANHSYLPPSSISPSCTQSLRFVCQLFCVRTLLSQRPPTLPLPLCPCPAPSLWMILSNLSKAFCANFQLRRVSFPPPPVVFIQSSCDGSSCHSWRRATCCSHIRVSYWEPQDEVQHDDIWVVATADKWRLTTDECGVPSEVRRNRSCQRLQLLGKGVRYIRYIDETALEKSVQPLRLSAGRIPWQFLRKSWHILMCMDYKPRRTAHVYVDCTYCIDYMHGMWLIWQLYIHIVPVFTL